MQQPAPLRVDVNLAQRPSGLVVPANLANVPEVGKPGAVVARDLDGRRRVVLSDELRRKLNSVILELKAQGFGLIVGCRNVTALPDGTPACGQLLAQEAEPDAGYGCQCSRIHWLTS
jgi:hypothetical protein